MSIKGDIVTEYLAEFPDSPSLTLAKKIFKENPAVFTNISNARSVIRYHRGQNGEAARKRAVNKEFFTEAGSVDPFDDLPEGMTYYDEWEPYRIKGERVLVLADIHAPYYHKAAIKAAINYGKREEADTILFLGDLIDYWAISRWEKDPRQRNIQGEIDSVRELLDVTRTIFPNATIIIKTGNHDERMESFLNVKAPELLGFEALTLASQFQIDAFGAEIVQDKPLIKIGKLNLIHGHEFQRGAFGGGVNPARWLYLKGKENAMCGHFHRTSEHAEKSLTDDVTVCWSVGCLSDLRPRFAPFNMWNLGFAFVRRDRDEFFVNNLKIINGEIY